MGSAPLRALVVEDEALAREEIVRHVHRCSGLELVGVAVDGLDGLEQCVDLAPAILFLDVQMPGLDGFRMLQALRPEERPMTVFVTAHDRYALQAFEAQAIDYLLKPFDEKRFDVAVARAIAQHEVGSKAMDALLAGVVRDERPSVVARAGSSARRVPLDEVVRLEAARNYVRLVTHDGELLTRSTLASLERQLDQELFVRVHRSHIVALAQIRGVTRSRDGSWMAELQQDEDVPVGRAYRDAFLRRTGL